jgi:hypothetical protein
MSAVRPDPRPFRVLSGAVLLVLAGCSGGSDSDDGGNSGAVTVAVTDAPSDEVAAFVVEVESFVLHKSDGGQVSVLGSPVTVDLTSLTDFSQVLNMASVPSGSYVGADATFDYGDASVVLHDEGTPATLLDAEGDPLTGLVTYPIQFPTSALSVPASKHVLLELDVDLDQSMVVDAGLNTVWVEPVLALHVDPDAPKQLLAIGTLTAVDVGDNTFTAQVVTFGGAPAGTLEFLSVPASVFQIDGENFQGAAGLARLAVEPAGTSIQVYGAADPNAPRYIAAAVAAGTGTFNGGLDMVEGYVMARGAGTSPVLTVLGHSLDASHTTFQFDQSFQVTTALAGTQVVIPGTALNLGLDDVNVGQRVRIFGELSGTNLAASAPGDVVVLLPTNLYGLAATVPLGGVQTLELSRIGPWDESLFAWVGSGFPPTDPDALTADVGGLGNGLAIGPGTALEVRGFFSAVDADSDTEDLIAISLTNLDTAPSLLFVRDLTGTGHALEVSALTSLVQLEVTGTAAAGEVAEIDKGFAGSLPLPSSPVPALEPKGSGLGLFLVFDSVQGTTRLHLSFGAFASDLAGSIAAGAHVRHVAAIGDWDALDNRLAAALASAGLE